MKDMKGLSKAVEDGFTQITSKVRGYSIAVVSGDVDLQRTARQGAMDAMSAVLDDVHREITKATGSADAGPNSQEKVGERVHAVLGTPNGKQSVGVH